MPGYELSIIAKVLHGAELRQMLKRSLTFILENGCIVRKLEYLGEKRLPYRMSAHSQSHTHGQYFLVDFHGPTTVLPTLRSYFRREIDVIRPVIVRHETEKDTPNPSDCEGPFSDLYQPKIKNPKKLLPKVAKELKDIKL
ncbi:28S ribosomal protein S6, mitochondrial [Holothuria leucospilota]|uniref:Small ribosomal subunit protein bS6m n=1 Tax=Holothuria leucospilota TaxID=206669 RepID=A0A9Q0YUG6_HOLLE|nr:28S ribosomal protein S6, mitochondrial [Holothuria leucospilota]